jgi:hypothetical protein
MITDRTVHEWIDLCHSMTDTRPTMLHDFMMATGPGEAGRMCIYEIDDASPLATWIHLKHPEWIDYVWQNLHRNAQIIDSQETFFELITENTNGRTNTTP